MASHVNCKGGYPGCLKRAHTNAVLDLCKPCREARRAENLREGKDLLGRQIKGARVLDLVGVAVSDDGSDRIPITAAALELVNGTVSDALGGPIADGLHSTRAGLLTDQLGAYLMQKGAIGLGTEDEGFEAWARAHLELGEKLQDAPPAIIEIADAEMLSYEQRKEIRDMVNSRVATRDEVQHTYQLSASALDAVLSEPDREPKPTVRGGRKDPEHMAKMRQAKQARRDAELAELEQLRARAAAAPSEPLPGSVRWSVTVLRPVTETIEAPNMNLAIAEARTRFGVTDEQVIGIVRE